MQTQRYPEPVWSAECRHRRSAGQDCTTPYECAQFVAFLTHVISAQPARKEIHVICDNVSSHKTEAVQTFLADHTNVSIHYTPTYSSWLNQVENWFARIQRDVITRGVFTSTTDLDNKLMRYIRQYNKQAAPLKWKYSDPTRRIRCHSSGSID
ncbi:transposase [Paraburkholderia atlantica]|uniref:transposase n=1 Tax=Paraburkholderia atlantica TaxID=2654982 RepID=UPI0034A03F66